MRVSKPEAIFFDMGGVLLESADMWDESGFWKSFPDGLPEPVSEAWFLGMSKALLHAYEAIPAPRHAMDPRSVIREWLPRVQIDPAPETVERWYAIIAQWEVRPLYPFVRPTLETLHRMGYRLGLISNTLMIGEGHRTLFRDGGILELFEFMVFSAEFGMNKPDPSIFQHALKSMAVPADRAWYVGDKPHRDIGGAHGVGMTAVLVDSIYHHRILDAPENVPDLKVPDISAIPELLRGLETAE